MYSSISSRFRISAIFIKFPCFIFFALSVVSSSFFWRFQNFQIRMLNPFFERVSMRRIIDNTSTVKGKIIIHIMMKNEAGASRAKIIILKFFIFATVWSRIKHRQNAIQRKNVNNQYFQSIFECLAYLRTIASLA